MLWKQLVSNDKKRGAAEIYGKFWNSYFLQGTSDFYSKVGLVEQA